MQPPLATTSCWIHVYFWWGCLQFHLEFTEIGANLVSPPFTNLNLWMTSWEITHNLEMGWYFQNKEKYGWTKLRVRLQYFTWRSQGIVALMVTLSWPCHLSFFCNTWLMRSMAPSAFCVLLRHGFVITSGFVWDVIAHPCPNASSGSVKSLFKLEHGRSIPSHKYICIWNCLFMPKTHAGYAG